MMRPRLQIAVGLLLIALQSVPAAAANGTPEIVDAARRGDRAAVIGLLRSGADVNAAAGDGTTALHWAVYHEDVDLVKRLIKARANVQKQNRYGATPMSEASVTGNVEILRSLLRAGADVESPNAEGQTALMIVARSSNVAAAKLLLDHGARVNAREMWRQQTPLIWAAGQSQPEMIRLLLKYGADPNARSAVNRWERGVSAEPRVHFRRPGGWTPLLYAARQGCVECVRALIDGGADPDMADPENVTPLLLAIINLHFDVAKLLLERGANPNKWDWRGRTPLYAAVDMNTLPQGGWPDRPSLDRTTPLELIELLLKAGANPNAQLKLYQIGRSMKDDRGRDLMLSIGATPLLRAAKAFDAPAMRLLLKYGADPELANEGLVTPTHIGGITPIMAAAGLGSRSGDARGKYDTPDVQERSIQALQILLAAGADINARDHAGRTALHGAASWGWSKVVQFLVDHNADLFAKDRDGHTPLDAALGKMREGRFGVGRERPETAALLRELMATRQPGAPARTAQAGTPGH